jgi:cobyrinic acid a,c-diamide synthase
MPDCVCRKVFTQGARNADLALVEGTLDEPGGTSDGFCQNRPGQLRPIAEVLDLPIVAVITCRSWSQCHLPRLPRGVEAVVLDGLESPEDFDRFRRMVRLTLGKPVLGGVEALPDVREALRFVSRDNPPSEELTDRLAASFLKFADLEAIRALSQSRPFSLPAAEPIQAGRRRFRVAYAQDEAFGGYFPDTLETLEALGAELVEFSPIRDESLPEAVDLVMIGCGYPDRHADALADNASLKAALTSHVCRGHRIYSEGGGTAYLGHNMIIDGRHVRGVGILPFDAELSPDPAPPTPVTRTLIRDGWLGPKGTVVRGYRSGRWRLVPGAPPLGCPTCYGPLTDQGDFYHHHHAVGSLIHLHLGALPEVVAAFAGPHRPSLTLPSSRS